MKKLAVISVLLPIFVGLVMIFPDNGLAKTNNTEIMIIDVTDRDIKKYGRFPWTRDIHGKAVSILSQKKARGVLFDMVFSEADTRSPEKDQKFAHAIAEADIPVFIPFFFVRPGGGMQIFPYPVQTVSVTDPSNIKSIKLDVLPSLEKFINSTPGSGFNNIFPNTRGVLEDIITVLAWNKKYYPFIGITIAAYYFNIPVNKIILRKDILYFGSKQLKLGKEAAFRPDFGSPFNKYKHYAYSDLFEEKIDHIKGKFVIMGYNATGLSDFVVTKSNNRFPGTEIHAVFIDYLLNEL